MHFVEGHQNVDGICKNTDQRQRCSDLKQDLQSNFIKLLPFHFSAENGPWAGCFLQRGSF